MKLLIHSQTAAAALLISGNVWLMRSCTSKIMGVIPSMLELKLIHVSKRWHRWWVFLNMLHRCPLVFSILHYPLENLHALFVLNSSQDQDPHWDGVPKTNPSSLEDKIYFMPHLNTTITDNLVILWGYLYHCSFSCLGVPIIVYEFPLKNRTIPVPENSFYTPQNEV